MQPGVATSLEQMEALLEQHKPGMLFICPRCWLSAGPSAAMKGLRNFAC